MVARSDEFNITNDEDHVMYEGEEGDVGTGTLEGSFQHGTNQEDTNDFPARRSNESACCREGNKIVTSNNVSCNEYEKEKIDSSSVGKEEGNSACVASDTNDDMGSQTDRRSDICGTDFENHEEARKSSQDSNDGEKKEIQEHAAGCTLYVRNLPPHIRTENMKEHFTQFGEVVDCRIIMNPVTKDSRGFGFVSFATAEIADMAMEKSADIRIDGKLLRVEKARRNRPHDPTPGEYKGPTGASIKYDNCGRLKPGYVPFWHLPFVKGDHGRDSGYSRHYRRSYSRDQGRVGGYRGGASCRLSGAYASRHYRHHDSPVNRDHYYKGNSQNRHRSSPYNSGRASYQGVHASLRDTGYHRSAHYTRGSSRESSIPMMKSSSKYYETEHLHVHEDDTLKPHRFSSRYSREPSSYEYEHSRRHASRQGSNPPSQNWEKSSREPYSAHVSKDHRRPVPIASSVHRSVPNDSYGFAPPSVETVSPSKSYYATGSSLHAPNRSSGVYESRHNSRSAAPSCVDHEYYETSNPVGNADRYGIGSYPHGNSSRLRSRGVSGEQFSHHGTTLPYGSTRGSSVSRRRLSPSPTPNASNRYAPHSRNAPSTLMRGVPSNEQGGNSLYVSNERLQRHISTARSRSPLDVRGAPAPSSFVCHH